MPTPPPNWLPLLHTIADAADAIALRHFRRADLAVARKGDASPVTDADRGIEEAARRIVAQEHPSLGVLGEETGETASDGSARLIIDPIDGTRNFVRGIPVFATLLAIEAMGDVVAGLVSAPALGLRWHAARGHGAFCGPRRLRVSSVARLPQAQLFHGSIGGVGEGNPLPTLLALARQVERTRGFGDFYQHVLVAEGAGEVAVDPVVQAWDAAALQVLVEEAGGKATTLAGARDIRGGSLVSSNHRLHDAALAVLAGRGT
ncbi:MAG: histidinol phosphatase [Gemmatimonadota bacterium]|nr:histidinol phosphatase [Gemmatimonadota bacterium]